MVRAVVQITLFGLLLTLVTTQPNKDDWDIYSFHINSTVTSRYATTVITSRVANRMEESKEIEFHVRIPKNAFISKFRMFMDGQVYDGVVKAKEQAQQQYTQAVSRGQSAGLVSSVGRTLEEFKTSVTVAAHKKVTFELTYEELLKRKLGKYELQIHARPMQPVKDFKVDVYIHDTASISYIEVKGDLSTEALANAITKTHTDKQAWVYFYPTEEQQKTCGSCGNEGMNGDLVIVYDVNRDTSLGHITSSSGYFVHHFAPSSLPRIPKNVVFVIDQSGSMHGRKIEQTRIALIHILNDLKEDDYFGLITFDSSIFHWKRKLVQATKRNLESAKNFAQNIKDRGATDINSAVLEGARMLNANPRETSASILILLTDGDPTTGVTALKTIQSNAREAIGGKFPLYCLGFGFDVNFDFLKTMSLQNNGVARRIYEDSDADLQLKGFYEEVATPLLTDVTMIYLGGTNLTQTNFSQYYNGSEIVVAGQITDNSLDTFIPQVVAISGNRKMIFSDSNATVESTGAMSEDRIQRVWAYLTVQQLLEKELQSSETEKEKVKKEALELSLKYSFVTPLTSMVVTKPPGENTDVLHKPKEGETPELELGLVQAYQKASSPRLIGGTSVISRVHSHGYSHSPKAPRNRVMMHRKPPLIGGSRDFQLPHISGLLLQGGFDAQISRFDNLPAPTVIASSPILANDYDDDVQNAVAVTTSSLIDEDESLPATATSVPLVHRFLLKTENQSLPLCFDVTGNMGLKLLHQPSRELSINGELDSEEKGGFSRIVIHFRTDQYVEIDTREIIVHDGQRAIHHTGEDLITAGSVTVIKRQNEVDVAAGDIRIVILLQEKSGIEFLWPVLRQKSSDNSTEGILVLKPAVYQEVQQTPLTKLIINDQEIDVTRSRAVDYSIIFPPTLDCWLMSAESALQRPLDDFIVSQI
ncbi:inter-alpha-trypsin inhibitor heavy chain H3 isoform X2 [Toxotes jaculatrix]|uniref:inter-alpha-trypsin inhibitor heavy chain H3 isoform X2 n=1 Tax=Toxotes jaculatrix TaxID=941984 RepID=UPI001B3B037C|nr:inter-alpha-trypsin inhibitor heavy chain H3 isoform X2 [Toxotes jaculatrix]